MESELIFRPSENFQAQAESIYSSQAQVIQKYLLTAEVHHVGSTSLPKALTKGDVDLNVRVEQEEFETAIEQLKQLYTIHQPHNWTESFASFKDDTSFSLPLGIQLTYKGGNEDHFLHQRDTLISSPELIHKLNDLKRAWEGYDENGYRKAKHDFLKKWIG